MTVSRRNSLPVIGVGLLSLITDAPTAHLALSIVLAALGLIACATGWRYVLSSSDKR
jgi:putative flippase GtrA